MSNKNRTGAIWGAGFSFGGVISTAVGVALGVMIIHGAIDPAFVVGAETTSGGILILLFLLAHGTKLRALWSSPKELVVFTTVSIVMNIGFVMALGAIASGGLTQSILMICELGGAVLITTMLPVLRRGLNGLIGFAILAILGVVTYVDPFGGAALGTQGLIGSILVGFGMGMRIEYAAHLRKEVADVGKQVGSVLSGLVIIAWSLANNGIPTIPDSFGNENLGSVDLTGLPIWAGALVLGLGVALCGLLTTGLPAFLENAAIGAGTSSNVVAIVHMTSPFVAAPVDVFVHGASRPGLPFVLGLALVIISAICSTRYLERMRGAESVVDKVLHKAQKPSLTVFQLLRNERMFELAKVEAELERLVAERAVHCRHVDEIKKRNEELQAEVRAAMKSMASDLSDPDALGRIAAADRTIDTARRAMAQLVPELRAVEAEIKRYNREIRRVRRSLPGRLGGTGTRRLIRLLVAG